MGDQRVAVAAHWPRIPVLARLATTEENQYLTNPPEIASTYPERLQRLIGYDYGAHIWDSSTGIRLSALQPEHDGPRNRTSPEVGIVEPHATPPMG